jgi:hypothetical protein
MLRDDPKTKQSSAAGVMARLRRAIALTATCYRRPTMRPVSG